MPFSVSAAIGFIALFGIAVMDGIIIVSQYNKLIDARPRAQGAILRTGATQMRPVLMTCVIAGVGLVPAALSSGIGSQVQKPLALVVVGGMALAPLLILTILPVLIALFSRRRRTARAGLNGGCSTRRLTQGWHCYTPQQNTAEHYDPAGTTMNSQPDLDVPVAAAAGADRLRGVSRPSASARSAP